MTGWGSWGASVTAGAVFARPPFPDRRRGASCTRSDRMARSLRLVRSEGFLVELVIGLALVVISALLIVFIVRTVQANMPRA